MTASQRRIKNMSPKTHKPATTTKSCTCTTLTFTEYYSSISYFAIDDVCSHRLKLGKEGHSQHKRAYNRISCLGFLRPWFLRCAYGHWLKVNLSGEHSELTSMHYFAISGMTTSKVTNESKLDTVTWGSSPQPAKENFND